MVGNSAEVINLLSSDEDEVIPCETEHSPKPKNSVQVEQPTATSARLNIPSLVSFSEDEEEDNNTPKLPTSAFNADSDESESDEEIAILLSTSKEKRAGTAVPKITALEKSIARRRLELSSASKSSSLVSTERLNDSDSDSDSDYGPVMRRSRVRRQGQASRIISDDDDDDDFIDDYLSDDSAEEVRPARIRGVAGGFSNDNRLRDVAQLNATTADATEELPTPPEMNLVLMKHQRQALAWMARREDDHKTVGNTRGGILADDQGFGKTCSAIALMLTNRPERDSSSSVDPAWGNLIVAPLSVMHQWARELKEKIDVSYRPRICIYHGAGRTRDPRVLLKYDVVITSYGTLQAEYPKALEKNTKGNVLSRRRKGPIYKVRWYRAILDEAHAFKNRFSDTFGAAISLKADRRWSLTGTPIQNSIDDIYSQFMFIKYQAVATYRDWTRLYKRPIEGSGAVRRERAFKRLQALLGIVLLRRAKCDRIDGRPVIQLPERNVVVQELEFPKEEQDFYHSQESRAIRTINDLVGRSVRVPGINYYANILLVLLRLRQACDHPLLCQWTGDTHGFSFPDAELDAVEQRMKNTSYFYSLPESIRERIMVELGPNSDAPVTCPVCMDVIIDSGVITMCGHMFCSSDFDNWRASNDSCPTCRGALGDALDVMDLMQVRKEVHTIHRAQKREDLSGNGADTKLVKSEPARKKPRLLYLKNEAKLEECAPIILTGLNSEAKTEPVENSVAPAAVADSNEIAEDTEEQESDKSKFVSSTKIRAFMSELQEIVRDTDDKVLCFSQWTRMLDLIAVAVEEAGMEYVRLDGTMSLDEREDAVREFRTRSKCRLFLISLKAGSTGLNLTVANRVFLMDCWWNPAVDNQAIDRVHRIGQTKPVRVVRYVIKGTVENRVMALQEKKGAIVDGALGVEGLKTIGRRRLTMQELLNLFSETADNVAQRAEQARDMATAQAARNMISAAYASFS